MTLATKAQVLCLCFFAVLAGLFAQQKQWPVTLYYVGCMVKDSAVLLLALHEALRRT